MKIINSVIIEKILNFIKTKIPSKLKDLSDVPSYEQVGEGSVLTKTANGLEWNTMKPEIKQITLNGNGYGDVNLTKVGNVATIQVLMKENTFTKTVSKNTTVNMGGIPIEFMPVLPFAEQGSTATDKKFNVIYRGSSKSASYIGLTPIDDLETSDFKTPAVVNVTYITKK